VAESAGGPLELLAAGRARLAAGETLNALALLRSACAGLPKSGEAHFLLGAALHRSNQLAAALSAFERALELEPENLEAAQASLAVLCQLGRANEARERVEDLLRAHPHDSQLHYNAALIHESVGDFARAVEHYDCALRATPDKFEALMNRGVALTRLGRLSEALANNQRLAAAHPERVESHFNLAEVLLATSRYADALAHADRALALEPQHAGATLDRGLALAALGQLAGAQESLTRAKALGAESPRVTSLDADSIDGTTELHAGEVYVTRAYERLEACDWSGLSELRARFEALIDDKRFGPMESPALGFRAMMLGLALPRQFQLAGQIARRCTANPATDPAPRLLGSSRRLRVGYVSSDFRDHPMGHLITPLIEHHDRSRYEVFAYALVADDGSEYRRRLVAASDRFTDASGASSEALSRAIRSDGVDVLVNLNGYTTGHRTEAFALRSAPIQVSYFGFPATMGASFIDYLIADRTVVPEDEARWYVESLVWLPHCYFSGDRGEVVPPVPARAAAGLPESGVIFCDFNQHVKITPDVFETWMRILGRVAGSVLWLLAGAGEARLRGHAAAAAIDPGRLVFAPRLPRREHLARAQLADLFLDTRPCNAHTTATDALRAGVPVLTCPGETFAGRVAASLARAAGLAELVVPDLHQYEELAVALAHGPGRLGALKRRLNSSLGVSQALNPGGRARELEAAYATMIERHRMGLPPAAFGVPAGR